MESLEHNGTEISPPIWINRLIFNNKVNIFPLVLSGYAKPSHNFRNLVFETSSLPFSVQICLKFDDKMLLQINKENAFGKKM